MFEAFICALFILAVGCLASVKALAELQQRRRNAREAREVEGDDEAVKEIERLNHALGLAEAVIRGQVIRIKQLEGERES